MKAMVIIQGEAGGKLEWRDVPEPVPRPGELLMRVRATALNRADLYQLRGTYDPTQKPADGVIAGLEATGEVAEVGKDASGFEIGDRVMSMCPGGFAEFAAVDHRLVMPVPARLSWEEAASIPVAYSTEYNALVTNGCLQPGKSVVINAASSGVGVAAIQIARLFGAKPVIGIAGSPEKLSVLKSFGMDLGVNYRTEDFADAVLAATGGVGADVIIDHVGGSFLQQNLRCMAVKGRLISVGRLGETRGELDLELMARKRLQLIGVTFRTRSLEEKIAIVQGVIADLLPPLGDGTLRPVVDRIFKLEEAPEAQAYMDSNAQIGKIVLKVGEALVG
jgi:NADPH2:quinone reductase